MKRIFVLAMFFVGLSLHAQRYRPAKIIFRDSTVLNGLVENSLEPSDWVYSMNIHKTRITFKKTKSSPREFLDVKKIDRIILFDKSMNIDEVMDFVPIKEFNLFNKKIPLSDKTQIKLLPLLFETEKYRVYRYELWVNKHYDRTYIYIKRKDQKYGYHFELIEHGVVLTPSYISFRLLLQVRAMQEFGKDCPAFLSYLKPLYQKYTTRDRAIRKQTAKEFKKLKKSFKSRKEFELYLLMTYLKKYEELCGQQEKTHQQLEKEKQNRQ